MKRLRWQFLIIFLTGIVVAILLLFEQQPGSGPVTGETTATPISGGVYSEALVGSLQRLNPVLDFNNQVDRDLDSLLFSGLLKFDSRGIPQGDLAGAWGMSKDGLLYNITIREDARWHDGKAVTANDVVFTIDLLRAGGEPIPPDLSNFWKKIEVVALGEKDLQFVLPEAFAPFADYLTFGVLPQHLLGGKALPAIIADEFNLKPVGSGPFQFSRLLVSDGVITGVELKANSDYYQEPPYLDQIVFHYFPNAAAAYTAYQNGEVKGIGEVPNEILPQVLAEPDLGIYSAREPRQTMVLFNLGNQEVAFLQDKQVRRALLTALNRQKLINQALGGQGIIADGPIFPGTWAYYSDINRVEYDPEAALDLLKQAGFIFANEGDTVLSKEGQNLSFQLVYPDTEIHRMLAESIQAAWLAVGVDVRLEAFPYDQLVTERLVDRSYEAALVELNLSRSPDPDPFPFWDQANANKDGQNYSQWDNRMASEYLEQARVSVDINQRAKMYRNFQVIFQDELPALPLFYPIYSCAVSREVRGVSMGPLLDPSDRFDSITQWNLSFQTGPAVQPTEQTTAIQ